MTDTAIARTIELAEGAAPEWVELLPAGPEVVGRDGRKWRLDDAAAVAAASLDGAREIPIDWEHASDLKASKGEEAPAAGWITKLEARPSSSQGALWGKVEWTERGQAQVSAREYRYISPMFEYIKRGRVITRVLSAGLTNNPNFRMTALNRRGGDEMDTKTIMQALGLSEDASEEQAVTAINALKQERDTAKNHAESPSLDKFVPRAEHDQVLARAANAEAQVAQQEETARNAEIDAEITKALEAGKITPATKEYHVEQCKAEGGLERFRKYVEAAPEIARNTERSVAAGPGTALTGDAAKIAGMFGHTAEELKKYRT